MEPIQKKTKAKAKTRTKKMTPVVIKSSGICKTCSALPVGSMELTSLLLVLIFSLVSVLFTSILALDAQQEKIVALEAQVQQ